MRTEFDSTKTQNEFLHRQDTTFSQLFCIFIYLRTFNLHICAKELSIKQQFFGCGGIYLLKNKFHHDL